MSADNIYTTAFKLLTLGFSVLPSGGGDKHKKPLVSWTEYQKRLPTEAELAEWNDSKRPQLWGLVTGRISGVVVLDADTPETKAELEAILGQPHVITPRGGAHWYFRHPGHAVKTAAGVVPCVDIRADGGFVNVVGRRPDGEYQVITLPTPDTLLPWEKLPERIHKALNGSKPQTATDQAGAPIPEGQRNATLTSLAGAMRRRGMSQSAIEAALLKENQERSRPPLPEAEVRAIAESVSRYEPQPDTGQPPVDKQQPGMLPLAAWRQKVESQPKATDLIQDILPCASTEHMMIAGRAGIGKTNLVLGMAFCLATGTPWFSHKVQRCRVGYLAFEGPQHKLLARFDKLQQSFSDPGDYLNVAREIPFKLAGKGIDRFLKLCEGLDVVIIDPIRYIVAGDYTKPEYASTFITTLRQCCAKTKTIPILLHHVRKPDRRLAVRPEDLINEVKGASDYVEAAGTVMLFERARQARAKDGRFGSNEDDRTLHFCKVKDSPDELRPLNLRLNRETLIYQPLASEYDDASEASQI